MHLKFYLWLLILCPFASSENLDISASKFYEEGDVHEYACSVEFNRPMNLDCACVNGLWLLYNTCDDNITISGSNQYCTRLPGKLVSKAVQLAKSPNKLTILQAGGTVKALEAGYLNEVYIDGEMTLITGSEWTLVETSGTRICLSTSMPNAYCYFSNTDDIYWILESIEPGCNTYDYHIDPFKCQKIEMENKNICEEEIELKRHKRDASSKPARQGRVFFGAPGQDSGGNSSNSTNSSSAPASSSSNSTIWLPMDDEDFFNSTTENKTAEVDSISTEIWNAVDLILDKLLGLEKKPEEDCTTTTTGIQERSTNKKGAKPPPPPPKMPIPGAGARNKSADAGPPIIDEDASIKNLNITYTNPVYEYLESCRRIIQKTCPPYYVKPEFLNLAVSAFIRIQKIHFKFPENTFKLPPFRRVLESLRRCEQNITVFNFSDANCVGKVGGNLSVFDQVIEMTITDDWAPKDRDPIVETVWKVFFSAHSFCYPFFNNKYSDHHRFTTWMMPLFQNQMNDLWVNGTTTANSLGGLFGDQVEVQANLAYCATSSRLDSKYPWDLPRPLRVPKFGPPLKSKGRNKREVDYVDDFDLSSPSGTCINSKEPQLCSHHVKSLAQSMD